eukprot:TRINITY_DN1334_c0_g1_i1.p1 TRINITY_DN1334_c0_g1~~TRINITY_DN1334_c0_g1_i1.p1  ORF type:complete len:176 (-),score=88.34 TRINITY_DN1334_c0_g1_i1:173-700(-)
MADPKVEDPVASGSDSGDEDTTQAGSGKQSRAEKKARKAISKMGLKPVGDITRATIRKQKNAVFTITNPDVFKHPTSDTYVIFGAAKVDSGLPGGFKMPPDAAAAAAAADAEPEEGVKVEEADDGDDDGEVDTSGLNEKDLDLVMEQAGVSKARAVKVLKKHDGDVVNAIMELSG